MKRRNFVRRLGESVSVASATAIAGCSTVLNTYKFEYVEDKAWNKWLFRSTGDGFVAGGGFRLFPGEYTYKSYSFEQNLSVNFDFEMESPTGVEIFVLQNSELDEFEERGEPNVLYQDQIAGDSVTGVRDTVPVGVVTFVLDNTDYGEMAEGSTRTQGIFSMKGEAL